MTEIKCVRTKSFKKTLCEWLELNILKTGIETFAAVICWIASVCAFNLSQKIGPVRKYLSLSFLIFSQSFLIITLS